MKLGRNIASRNVAGKLTCSRTARNILFFTAAKKRRRIILRNRLLKLSAGLLVTILCLAAALWGLDLEKVSESFAGLNYGTLPVILALLFLFFWLKAVRWRLLLSPLREFRTQEVVPPLMIGFMGNNVLPAHLAN